MTDLRRPLRTRREFEALVRQRDGARREAAAARREILRHVAAYRRLLAAALEVAPDTLWPLDQGALTKDVELAGLAEVGRVVSRLALDHALVRGESLDAAMVEMVRHHLRRGQHVRARSIAQALQHDPRTRVTGELADALISTRMGLDALAWTRFRSVPLEVLARLCPEEYALAAARTDPIALDAFADEVLDVQPFDPAAALGVLKALVGARRAAGARRVFDRLATLVAAGADVDDEVRDGIDWLAEWVQRLCDPQPPVAVPDGHIPFAVLGYGTADRTRTSSNIGDYVQTLAACSHLVRRSGVTFTGPAELSTVFRDLAARVRSDERVPGPERTVQLVEMNRDASTLDAIPAGTWALGFGWYMHSPFNLRADFPFHPNVNPIFVSFHVNRLEMLTPRAVDYLRRRAPIGCRDWNTVYLLLAAGVPAFFSGCVTTTVGALFPEPERDERKPVGYVDVPAPHGAAVVTQVYDEVRDRTLAQNLAEAVRLFDGYQRTYSRLVTSRLHCYLPAWSAGIDVDFTPHARADVRFHGLLDASEADRVAMRRRITTLLGVAFDEILSGASKEQVYAAWRQACAADVEVARRRFAALPPVGPLPFDLAQEVAAVHAAAVHIPRRVAVSSTAAPMHVAIAMDENLKEQAKVVAAGIVDNTARPVHLHVLCRGHDRTDIAAFAGLFPELEMTWLPCDNIDYGEITGMLSHITVATMDRLLLPYLLPEVAKVLYHDIDALAVDDVGELYDLDIGDAPLAARDAVERKVRFGLRTVWAATAKMTDPSAADDYLHRAARQLQHDFTSFNAGILLLNLDVFRADRFAEEFLPWVSRYGLNDQQLLNCYAGNRRVAFDPRWNALAAQEPVSDARLVHWAGHAKPWADEYIAMKDCWLAAEKRLAVRAETVGVQS